LALVGGLPGTGKTTVAAGLADRAGAVLLSSDRLRKELAGIGPDHDASAPYAEGLYSPARTDEVYAELLHRAGALLARGESVVVDASWTHQRHRRAADEVARSTHSVLVPLHCTAPQEVAHGRLATRQRTASDATAAIATALAADADPWPEARIVPTTGSVAHSVDRAVAVWAAATRDVVDRPGETEVAGKTPIAGRAPRDAPRAGRDVQGR
jgi:predicted kinase